MSAQDDDTSTYEETLETWALHDCSAIADARSQDEMSSLFERFRATLGKTTTVTRTVTIRSLDKAWTAFVNRWNKEGGAAFERCWRIVRQLTIGCPSLRWQLKSAGSRMTWIASAVSRISKMDVRAIAGTISRGPMLLSGSARRTAAPLWSVAANTRQGKPRTPPRSPERRREVPRVAPNDQELGQANAPGIGDVEGRHRHGGERRDLAVDQRDHRRAGGLPPRYGARYPRDRQEE
ncbi:hypothetical protein PC128_g7918 [Phytophthora cactorum]|nr:hypothetical protein PC128_g7918 [Phytophthora cactorum]